MIKNELLFSDLCGRIPYKVKASINGGRPVTLTFGDLDVEAYNTVFDDSVRIKPYLRSISKMTESERQEFSTVIGAVRTLSDMSETLFPIMSVAVVDWMNRHYFDYRLLIQQGLALEAPDGMYSESDDEEDRDTVDCEVYGESDTSYKCSCGADLVSEGVVLTSNPPQYPYLCPKCGKRYVYGQSGRYSWDKTSDGSCDTVNYTFSTNGNNTISVTATNDLEDWHTTI